MIRKLFFHRIHVRRTDKASEADFYPLEAYLREADKFFELHQIKNPNEFNNIKNVYIASDDTSVTTEAVTK